MKILTRTVHASFVALAVAYFCACGGGGGSSSSNSSGGGGTTPSVSNTVSLIVNAGPANNSEDQAYTSVTICVPGTSTCQTIDNLQVDTGSSGLRVLNSALTIPLATQTSGNNTIADCVQFADGSFSWGPVETADVKIAGEVASSIPIHVINGQFNIIPASCSNGGTGANDVSTLGANGILGVGSFRQDCGQGCAPPSAPPGTYYSCSSSGCQPTSEPVASQVQNPVWKFPSDNNGVLVQFNAVADAGQVSATGTLVFGIGTQSNNSLGSATVLTINNQAEMTTRFNGNNYPGFIDSGSNGYFFLTQNLTGLNNCSNPQGFYCPNSAQSFSATNVGVNSASKGVTFTIQRADVLFGTPTFAAFNNVGGEGVTMQGPVFDFGLPFFFGKSVFTAIEGQTTPGGAGPYFAY